MKRHIFGADGKGFIISWAFCLFHKCTMPNLKMSEWNIHFSQTRECSQQSVFKLKIPVHVWMFCCQVVRAGQSSWIGRRWQHWIRWKLVWIRRLWFWQTVVDYDIVGSYHRLNNKCIRAIRQKAHWLSLSPTSFFCYTSV